MKVKLLYGRGELDVRLPDGCEPTVIEKPPMPVIEDPEAAVAAALEQGDLARASTGARSACILICDITRPVPNRLFLRPLVERLEAAGVPRNAVTVLVATGLHRPNVGDELAEVVGDPWVLEHVRVENHYARRDADHVDLGRTRRGTPIRLDRRFVEADVRIATGLVEPHFMAGYSGGRKVIAPGIAHADTITTFHNHRFMSDSRAENCVLDGNPLHREQLEILERIGGALALNTVIDDRRRLAFVNFGECRASHLDAVAFVRRYAEVTLPRRYATVVTSAAGYPSTRPTTRPSRVWWGRSESSRTGVTSSSHRSAPKGSVRPSIGKPSAASSKRARCVPRRHIRQGACRGRRVADADANPLSRPRAHIPLQRRALAGGPRPDRGGIRRVGRARDRAEHGAPP